MTETLITPAPVAPVAAVSTPVAVAPVAPAAPSNATKERPRRESVTARFFRNPLSVAAFSFFALVVLVAIAAPLLTSHDPHFAYIRSVLASPGAGHLLGADAAGRDVWARLLFGARNTLLGAATALVISMIVGTLSGLIAGYFGKWFDSLSSAGASLLQAVPAMVVLLAARAVIGPSMWLSMAVFGVILSASFFRLTRQTVQSVRDELYIDAARVSGLSDTRIIFRHVLRVVRAPMIIQAGFIASLAIAVQAGLEILGLGDHRLITWGGMLNDGFARLFAQPLLMLWPSIAIALTCLALTLISNGIRDALAGGAASLKPLPPLRLPAAGMTDVPTMTDDELLLVENLHIGYPSPSGVDEIVHGISFHVNRGEVVGLIGESGCGKSRTAFAIMRLLSEGGGILAGRVIWQGRDLASLTEKEMNAIRGAEIAYIPQEPMSSLDPSFTIGSQLIEPMRYHLGLSKKAAYDRAVELLRRVSINNPERVMASYPHEISGGMAQRVLIAGAISCDPLLIIADEPTTALDVTVQADILDLLRDLQRDFNFGILLVTHNFGVVADICDRVLVMQDGNIVERGVSKDIFADHSHPYTKQLFGSILSPDSVRAPYQPPVATSVVDANRRSAPWRLQSPQPPEQARGHSAQSASESTAAADRQDLELVA